MTETETAPVKLTNPYPPDTYERVQLWIGRNDLNFIRLIRPQMGTFAAIGGYLWQGLCAALRRQGITDFSNLNEFENFISNLTIIHQAEYEQLKSDSEQWQRYTLDRNIPQPGRPVDGTNTDTNEGNVRKRAKRVRPVPTDKQEVSTDLPGDNVSQPEKGQG